MRCLIALVGLVSVSLVACDDTPPDGSGGSSSSSTSTSSASATSSGDSTSSGSGSSSSGGGPTCGDGMQDQGEACDDGNKIDGDGCEANCTLPACQNGVVDPGEVCWGGAFAEYPLPIKGAESVFVVDCNGDTKLDVVAVGRELGMFTPYRALPGDGTGALGVAAGSYVLGSDYVRIISGEFNGMPGTDLAGAFHQGTTNSLRTFPATNTCTFGMSGKTIDLGTGNTPRDLVAFPFDADAIDDLASLTENGMTPASPHVSTYKSTSPDPPTKQVVFAFTANPTAITAGLLDAGTSVDIAYTDAVNNKVILRSNMAGVLGPVSAQPVVGTIGGGAIGIAAGDLDSDMDVDLVTINSSAGGHTISVLLNDGAGNFTLAGPDVSIQGMGPNLGRDPRRLTLADMDADGDLDVLTGNFGDLMNPTPTLTLLINDGAGTFTIATTSLFPLVEKDSPMPLEAAPGHLRVVDMNGDGALDLVTTITVIIPGPTLNTSKLLVLLARP